MEQYSLSNNHIIQVCEKIEKFLVSTNVERREALRIKLALEEVLLEYQNAFGENENFTIKYIKRLSVIRVEVCIAGETFDPFGKKGDEDEVIRGLLAGIGLAPVWNYKNGKNRIVFSAKKKTLSDTVKIVLAIGLAIVTGCILNYMPEGITAGISQYLLTPVTDAFMGLINAVAGPLIFLSVLGSICSMGNMETFGKIGSKTIKIIISYMTVIGLVTTSLQCLLYRVRLDVGGDSNLSQVMDLVYDIIPSNLVEPFISGNALQLIFIAVMVGLAMLTLSSRVQSIFNLLEQITEIIQTMMGGLSSLLPVLIFVLFTDMIVNGNVDAAKNLWKFLLVTILIIAAYYTINLLRIAFTKKVSPVLLFKKAWPTFVIALTTASSVAAFATNTHDATEKLGIDKKLTHFAIPLGQVLFMPDVLITLFGMEITFATSCNIPITVPWLIIAFVSNLLVAFAVPPIPGGMLMGLTIVFNQLGIPMEMMALALAINAITDFPGSAINVSGWQLTMIDVADSLDMLDKDVLRKELS